MAATDKAFSSTVATLYESHMVPMLFRPYAAEMAARVAAHSPHDVLEIAAGTGAVTAAILAKLPADATLTATDLNQAMLDVAAAKLTDRRLHLRSCDAQSLPFADDSFDAVVCQFGAMFFPDRLGAYRQARRALRAGGALLPQRLGRPRKQPLHGRRRRGGGRRLSAKPARLLPPHAPRLL